MKNHWNRFLSVILVSLVLLSGCGKQQSEVSQIQEVQEGQKTQEKQENQEKQEIQEEQKEQEMQKEQEENEIQKDQDIQEVQDVQDVQEVQESQVVQEVQEVQSIQSDVPAAGTMDEKLKKALSRYTFYHGLATVMEDQRWTSKKKDGSHGEGDAVLTSEDYLVFDTATKKLYIVARNLTYNSKHKVTVNDMNGTYLNTAHVSATGELQEFYSWGFVLNNSLSFSALPVRADGLTKDVFTRPETYSQQWVAYTSTADTVRLGADRVMPPDVSKNPMSEKLPALEELKDSKSYGNKDVFVYEATTRFWNLKGTFDYHYKKIPLNKMLEGVNSVIEAQQSGDSFSKRAEPLPEVWQITAVMGDQLVMLANASAQIAAQTKGAEAALASSGKDAKAIVNALKEQPVISDALNVLDTYSGSKADQSAQRRLEGAVLKTKDQKLAESHKTFIKTYNQVIKSYGDKQQQFNISLRALKPESADNAITKLRKAAEAMEKEGLNLIGAFELFKDKIGSALQGDSLKHLDALYRSWSEIVDEIPGNSSAANLNAGVSLPSGYPKALVPIMPEGKVVIVNIVPAEGKLVEGYMVTCVLPIKEKEVFAFYRNALKTLPGYEETGFGDMKVLNATNKIYNISVLITKNTLGGKEPVMIQISITDRGS